MRHAWTLIVLAAAGCGGGASPRPVTPGTPVTRTETPVSHPTRDPGPVVVDESGDAGLTQAQSAPVRDALAFYDAGQTLEAALLLQRLVEGELAASPRELQLAQLFLAKALFHLGFPHSSLTVLDEITQQAGHLAFLRAAPWLAVVGPATGNPETIDPMIGRYTLDQLAEASAGQPPELEPLLRYRLGRSLYASARFNEALEAFRSVPASSSLQPAAGFFRGMIFVRTRQDREALGAFRELVLSLRDPPAGADEPDRMRDLAWLSIARLHFSTAGDHDDPHALGQALAAYSNVAPTSSEHLEARFEEAWTLFRLKRQSEALQRLDQLPPSFILGVPEVHVLRALIAFSLCDAGRAFTLARDFQEQHRAAPGELTTLADRPGDQALLHLVEEGLDAAPPVAQPVLERAITGQAVRRQLAQLDVLREETRHLTDNGELRSASLGERILQDLAVAQALVQDEVDGVLRGRLRRHADELQELMNQAATLQMEADSVLSGGQRCTP